MRELAQQAIEDRAAKLREQNRREGPSYRKMAVTRRAYPGGYHETQRGTERGRFASE